MFIRNAIMEDLPQLIFMYKRIVKQMKEHHIEIWDDMYPCICLEDDIRRKQLYVCFEDHTILSAFALCTHHEGAAHVKWKDPKAKAVYLERLAVSEDHTGKGIGFRMLKEAMILAKNQNAKYLRLFVVKENIPAISLYQKAGFIKVDGIYNDKIDDDVIFQEFGYETCVISLGSQFAD